VSHFLIFLVLLAAVAGYLMTREERSRFLLLARAKFHEFKRLTMLDNLRQKPGYKALYARSRWAPVTPTICTINIAIFVLMLLDGRGTSAPETLAAWGASISPRTLNGEWWRMLTTLFVHPGVMYLLVSIAGLLQLGLILERFVGAFAFAGVYLAAGISASLIGLFTAPESSVGAAPAILGTYGLLAAASMWSTFRRGGAAIPLEAFKRIAPGAALFILYAVATRRLDSPGGLTGLAVGFAGGLVMTKDISTRKPPMRLVAGTMAAAVAIAAAAAVIMRPPQRDLTSVRSEVEHLVAIEAHTTYSYGKAVERFKKGLITAQALTDLIDRTILPELHAAAARLKALDRVPDEQRPLVSTAEHYLSLRDESWRLRAKALRASDMMKLREADRKEQASLDALEALTAQMKDLKAQPGN